MEEWGGVGLITSCRLHSDTHAPPVHVVLQFHTFDYWVGRGGVCNITCCMFSHGICLSVRLPAISQMRESSITRYCYGGVSCGEVLMVLHGLSAHCWLLHDGSCFRHMVFSPT